MFLQIPFFKQKKKFHTSFNKALLHDEDALFKFEGAWKDAMGHAGPYSKGTRFTIALELIRRLNVIISREKKRNAMNFYRDQFKEIEEAKAGLQLD